MRRLLPIPFVAVLAVLVAGPAAGEFDIAFELALERVVVDGVTLGDEAGVDRREEHSIELELDLEYALGDDAYLFYTAALFADSETLESSGAETRDDGVEHRQAGIGLFFGDTVQGRLRVGRVDIGEDDAWWAWVDDEVDALDLELAWRDVEARLLVAEAQARRSSAESRIDPELEDVRHALLMLDWEFAPQQSVGIDVLRQRDRSSAAAVGETFDAAREDEVDADLDWLALRYRGLFEIADFADIEVELYRGELDGEQLRIESEEVGGGLLEVDEQLRLDSSASAGAWRVGLRPARWADWRLRVGALSASGDGNADDGIDRGWRQSGIHGDNEIYGVLYQPSLTNLRISMLAVDWRAREWLTAGVARFDYRKRRSAGEAPDSEIEFDADGPGRALGSEVDIFARAELRDGVDLQLTLARFDAGRAYGDAPSDEADYIALELDWQF